MKIAIISPGKDHDIALREAIEEYTAKVKHFSPIEWVFPKVGTKEEEAEKLLSFIKIDDYVVVLDEKGESMTSIALAELVHEKMGEGTKRIVFVIGGAYGVTDEVLKRAQIVWKLSSLTFPHMFVRLILIEQLYRTSQILSGGRYHHE
jgi:23S rRNA (pseudouridine1915-N3)-methyltransferase